MYTRIEPSPNLLSETQLGAALAVHVVSGYRQSPVPEDGLRCRDHYWQEILWNRGERLECQVYRDVLPEMICRCRNCACAYAWAAAEGMVGQDLGRWSR
jgi:hypothetical protein